LAALVDVIVAVIVVIVVVVVAVIITAMVHAHRRAIFIRVDRHADKDLREPEAPQSMFHLRIPPQKALLKSAILLQRGETLVLDEGTGVDYEVLSFFRY
jgi:regulator of protease activity HflC (stomatin/prohibitin superfamily)